MAATETKESVLGTSVFRDLPKEKLDDIAGAIKSQVVPAQGIIFREGDPGDNFYIVNSGKVRVYKQNERGVERDLSILGPGESFGEMALLTGEPRTANVQAVEETRLMVLSKDEFDRILRECPNVSMTFMKEMRTWLMRDDQLLEREAEEVYQASRLSWFDFLLVIGVSVVLALSFNRSNPNGIPLFPSVPDRSSIPVISVSAAMADWQRGSTIIVDAMPSNFYQKRHIKNAVNMPLALFDIIYMMTFAEEDKEKEIVVYGDTISRMYDLEIANKLMVRGYNNVKILDGGLSAWAAAGYPVEEKAKK